MVYINVSYFLKCNRMDFPLTSEKLMVLQNLHVKKMPYLGPCLYIIGCTMQLCF
jgi:hypothetical protein